MKKATRLISLLLLVTVLVAAQSYISYAAPKQDNQGVGQGQGNNGNGNSGNQGNNGNGNAGNNGNGNNQGETPTEGEPNDGNPLGDKDTSPGNSQKGEKENGNGQVPAEESSKAPAVPPIYTTDADDTNNQNSYETMDQVLLNGGPQGDYVAITTLYVRVTTPDGKTLIGSTEIETGDTLSLSLGSLSFTQDEIQPGTYKVWVSTSPDYNNSQTKTDNFTISSAYTVPGGGTGNPGGGTGNPGGGTGNPDGGTGNPGGGTSNPDGGTTNPGGNTPGGGTTNPDGGTTNPGGNTPGQGIGSGNDDPTTLTEEPIPGGSVASAIDDQTDGDGGEEEVILDDETPGGPATLPNTGGLNPAIFYGLGLAMTAAGLKMRRK